MTQAPVMGATIDKLVRDINNIPTGPQQTSMVLCACPKAEWKLVEITGKPVVFGESYPDFRGDLEIIVGGTPPHKPSSTGRVETSVGMSYFPGVFNLKWVRS